MGLRVIGTVLALIATSIATTTTLTSSLPYTGPPYTPVSTSYSYQTTGRCEAVVSVSPVLRNQLIIDCSAIATPTIYHTTITKTVDVGCGPCTALVIEGEAHGCPEIPVPTTTTTASVPRTDWVFVCSQ
jgi:hypothetical protein